MAVKVTAVPAQIELELAAMVTEGVIVLVVILIVMVLDVAVAAVKQFASEVSTQATASPLAKLDEI